MHGCPCCAPWERTHGSADSCLCHAPEGFSTSLGGLLMRQQENNYELSSKATRLSCKALPVRKRPSRAVKRGRGAPSRSSRPHAHIAQRVLKPGSRRGMG